VRAPRRRASYAAPWAIARLLVEENVKAPIPETCLGALLAVAIFAIGFVVASAYYQQEIGSFRWPEIITAIFTVVLAVSTVFLWLATLRSAKIAERALTDLERPFVGIEIIPSQATELEQFEQGAIPNSLQFWFVNYGRTPATITQLADQLELCTPGQFPEPFDTTTAQNEFPKFGIIIGANNEKSPVSSRSYFDSECIPTRDLPSSAGNLFLLGFIRYRDIFGNRYRMGFCLKWTTTDNPSDGRFLFDGDEGYNYTLLEK
jgi:hypothetical protein